MVDIGYVHWDPNSPFHQIISAYVLGPFTYQQQLEIRANLNLTFNSSWGVMGGMIFCDLLLDVSWYGVMFGIFGVLRCWLSSIIIPFCLY